MKLKIKKLDHPKGLTESGRPALINHKLIAAQEAENHRQLVASDTQAYIEQLSDSTQDSIKQFGLGSCLYAFCGSERSKRDILSIAKDVELSLQETQQAILAGREYVQHAKDDQS